MITNTISQCSGTQDSAEKDLGTDVSTGTDAPRVVRSDTACWARATEFLFDLIGSPLDDLLWDETHHLQGHGHIDGCELVVIAPRDDNHKTVVLTAEDWDAVRRASADRRRDLLDCCAIADHNRLVAVVRDHGHPTGPLAFAA